MEKTTFIQFKKERYTYLFKGITQLDSWLSKQHKKAIYFINQLLAHKVKLSQININDWNSNTNPSVYVGSKQYSRLAKNDWKLALKSLNK